jgi:hypothetical protein
MLLLTPGGWNYLRRSLQRAKKELNALVILVSRELWLERNARVFDKIATLPMELCKRIKAEFAQWKRAEMWDSGSSGDIT